MASNLEQPPSPAQPPAPTTVRDLSDDLLRKILLRLPSLPSLVRAALTCGAFLAAVRSSPAFRRRFRALHPPPLLGFFFDHDGSETPTFKPICRRSDPDLAAAIRGLDVFLTRVPYQDDFLHAALFHSGKPDDEELFTEWQIMDCRGGCLLLNGRTRQLAAYNPLTGALDLVPMVADEINLISAGNFLIAPDDEASDMLLFRVFSLCRDNKESQVQVAVFSSATRKWQVLPVSLSQPVSDVVFFYRSIHVNGFLCWAHGKDAGVVLLDTETLQFSVIDFPPGLNGQDYLYSAGDTKDGKLCIVDAIDFKLFVWFWTSDADGLDKWVLQNVIQLEEEVIGATEGLRNKLEKLAVFAILDGIVYMTTYETFRDATMPCWYLSFCLETRKLEKIFYAKANGFAHPYFMSWPTSLVGMEHRAEGESEKLGNDDDREIITTLGAI